MRVALRSLLVCVLGVVLGGFLLASCASAAGLAGVKVSSDAALSGSPMVVPDAEWLFGVAQQEAAVEARRASTGAFTARLVSRTEFEHLGVAGAARVARQAFPALVEKRDGGLPVLPAGEKLRKFSAENVAQISLPDHERGIVESIKPMAIRTASGRFEPINLGLKDQGSSLTPVASQVAVQIPKHLGGGVRAPQSGVSLTPIDGKGEALHGSEGSVDGASVLYANTQTDTDTLAKPTSLGFELSAILRSEASPHELDYRLGLPSGASLVQHRQHSPVQVVKEGVTIGMVLPPTAVDATGTPVPVTMAVNGDILTVNVQDAPGEYQYPLQVDPEYVTGRDRSLTGGVWPVEHPKEGETNWVPIFSSAFSLEHTYQKQYGLGGNPEWYEQSWVIEPNQAYNAGEAAGLRYRTQGESTIYNLEMYVEGENEPSQTATAVEYRYNEHKNEGEEEGQDNHVTLSEGIHQTRYEYKPLSMTSGYSYNPLETPRNNDVRLMDYTTKHESLYGFWTWIYDAQVYVAQEESKHPEVESTSVCSQCGFNKSSPTITGAGGRTNVLYGSGTWLSPYQGAFEATAHDPGIGVSFAGFTGTVGYHPHWIRNEEGKCLGIQCPETYSDWMAYNASMPNGDDGVEFFAEDAAEMIDTTGQTVKVDASKPYNLGFTGMPELGAEISAAPHKLTVHATDGKKPTPSSGIRSVSVSIDGGTPIELSGASCPEGECTASGEYTLDAESLSEGVHRLVVSAVSNSGEPEAKEFLFDVRHATPVSVGPGSVDPTTGQFTLTAADVSLGGASGVSRSYQSRNLTSGVGGPFGPQWAMSVGGGEDLVVLPTGSVSVVSGNGGRTTFSLNSKSEFESPKGDENLKIGYKSTEHKYVLKDEKAGTETVFEQPVGTEDTPPQDANQFGAESSVLDRPVSDAIDSSGDIWVTDSGNNRIVKFSPTGTLIGAYGTYGPEAGEMIDPWGIAINRNTGNVYVADQGNMRVDEFSSSGTFIGTMGWGVSNGANEFQTCTSICRPGINGSNPGQFSWLTGIAVDSSGNLWIVDNGNDRIEEFNEKQEFIREFGSAGSAAGQFNAPMNIAFSGSNLYVTDQENARVQEFATSGTFVQTMGWGVSDGKNEFERCTKECRAGIAGAGNGQYSGPRGITVDPMTGNLYVTEMWNDRVQEVSTSGAFVTKFGSGGTGPGQFALPMGVVVNTAGEIYVTDFENARVQQWGRQTWWPTSAKGSLSKSTTYLYQSVTGSEGTSIEPSEVLSPAPESVSCGTKPEELKEEKDKGCHALTFKYATGTTAKGENKGEWGEYYGRLSEVIFHAWSQSSKKMEEKAVAQYSYDKQGRLRAEWDPRMESSTACGKTCSALKTTYGYDAEGHVASLTPPGQESWAFTYGTITGDASTGRLLKVMHAPASAALWNGEAVKNTEAPKLSGTPVVGVKMGVSHGSWSNSPVAYEYQWEDCNSEGKSCTPILGATNENYKVASSDVGHTLIAQVTAINGGGSVIAASAASAVVSASGTKTEGTSYSSEPGSTIEYHVPLSGSEGSDLQNLSKEKVEEWSQKDVSEYEDNDPVEGMAVFPPDEPQGWPALDYKRATIDYLNAKGLTVNTASPTGGVSTAEYNEINETVRTLTADNRATALKEGCKSVSKKECKSAEVSEKLDTRTEYSPNGGDIVKVLGPEHKIKLAKGEEVEARAVSHDYYDEGAQEAEEKNHETYNLSTRSTSGALLTNGEEKDVRTTITSYSGQKDLGWKLRKPTSVTTDPVGLDLVHTTVYNETTGDVVETKAPGGTVESVYPPMYSSSLGTMEGGGSNQFNHPEGTAIDSAGNLWVNDKGNHRLQKFSSSGELLGSYGSEAKEEGELKNTWGIAINQSTNEVFVSDYTNDRIDVFSDTGKFLRKFGESGSGNGKLSGPLGLAIDAKGNVWVADSGNNRVEEFSAEGVYLSQFGSYGTGNGQFITPIAVAISEGELYVVDYGNDRVEEFSHRGAYLNKFGTEGTGEGQLKGPEGVAVNPMSGDLYVSDSGNERIEEFSPAGKFLTEFGTYGLGDGGFHGPTGLTVGPTGKLYIADQYNARVDEWLPPEAGGSRVVYSSQFGGKGKGEGQFEIPIESAIDGSGNVWVTDYYDDRVEKFSATGKFLASYGAKGSGNDQFSDPTGLDINKSTGNVYVMDCGNHRVEELNSEGGFVRTFGSAGSEPSELSCGSGIKIDPSGDVWVADTGNNRIEEYSATGAFMAAYGSSGTGSGQFKEPIDIAFSGGNMYVTDYGNDRVQELSMTGAYIKQFGKEGSNDGEFSKPEGIAVDSAGHLYVVDSGNDRVEEFNTSGGFLASFGVYGGGEGQFEGPIGISINAAGDMYITNAGTDQVEIWIPENQAAHNTQTIYYASEPNSTYPNCGNHREWAGLPCQTQLAAQPDRGLPELPVTTMASYNIWSEVEKTEEKFGIGSKAVTRTKTETYDPAGRALTSEETASPATDTALPKVTNEYNSSTGALENQSTSSGTITSKYNTLGQLTEYKDASGNVAKYIYEEGGDGRLLEVDEGKGEEAKSTETYTYNNTTGFIEKLIDTAAGMTMAQGTFTASYDVEGKMTSDVYPDGMCANTTYNSVGDATSLEYIKTRNCSETGAPVWFSDSIAPSIHGETLQQTSTLAKENYAYDKAGRLLETQETPAGKGCVVRLYTYEEESNRTSETTREPGTEGKCATEGGTVERHTYDEANRLTDTSVEYETFGNTTKMSAADAGGHEITSTYYVDNQLASETQNGETFKYAYDPSGRTIETISEGKTSAKAISHYAGSGNALTWTSEGTEKWTRNIPGIDGALDAVQTGGGSVVLQLHDLQGNIVGTAGDNESETKMLTPYNSTEFGVPQPGTTPPKYAWLGAAGVSTETSLGSGVAIQGGASYVPQVARALQTAPVIPPGAFPNGSSGTQLTAAPVTAGAIAGAQEIATQFWQKAEAERQKAREEEAAAALRQCQEEGGCGAEEGGATVDPEGLLTGEEALELAGELNKSAKSLNYYVNEAEVCEHTLNPPACELELESGEKQDDALGSALEEKCYYQVHNPGKIHGHSYTKTCLLDFSYTLYADNYVVKPGWHLSLCFSYHVGRTSITYSTSEWWCESGGKWYTMDNRGFWRDD
jgi:tripartite motif-containing protein 71